MFENKDRCDFVLTDVLFAFEELYNTISDSRINSIIEIGSGTGILLNELSDVFPKKNFFGLDPHESGFHYYENIKSKYDSQIKHYYARFNGKTWLFHHVFKFCYWNNLFSIT